MERKIEQNLLAWKNNPDRRPLILLGSRQIGKTYSVTDFAKKYFLEYIYINFMENNEIKSFLKDETSPTSIINVLMSFYNIQNIKETLIIFDEIQEVPSLKTSLKMFCEQYQELYIISLGSYLSNLIDRSSFPVGKIDILNMKPMDFEEFLWSINQKKICEDIYNMVKNKKALDEKTHEIIWNYFLDYILIGGMPKAVYYHCNNKFLNEINNIKENIIYGYKNDLIKFIDNNSDKIKCVNIYDNIQKFLCLENKKYKLSEINKNARFRDYESAIINLIKSNIVYKVTNIKKPVAPLFLQKNDSNIKVYYNDIGMFSTILKINKQMLEKQEYGNVKGGIIENFFVQELENKIEDISFYTFMDNGNRYEIDFIIEDNKASIIPIEVKAGDNYKFKSLDKYLKINPDTAYSIVFSKKNFSFDKEKRIFFIPIYAVGFLEFDEYTKRLSSMDE